MSELTAYGALRARTAEDGGRRTDGGRRRADGHREARNEAWRSSWLQLIFTEANEGNEVRATEGGEPR